MRAERFPLGLLSGSAAQRAAPARVRFTLWDFNLIGKDVVLKSLKIYDGEHSMAEPIPVAAAPAMIAKLTGPWASGLVRSVPTVFGRLEASVPTVAEAAARLCCGIFAVGRSTVSSLRRYRLCGRLTELLVSLSTSTARVRNGSRTPTRNRHSMG